MKEVKKIEALQVVRAISFLGVVASHTKIKAFSGTGAWGVSVFFVLSGFVMIYNYFEQDRIKEISLLKNLKFSIRKIKKFYLLHVITMLAMLPFLFVGNSKDTFGQACCKIILNLLLIQEWFPINESSINGVSWYLSVSMFIYFLFPWILRGLEKEDNTVKKSVKRIVILFIIQILVCYTISKVHMQNLMGIWFEYDLVHRYVYRFPLTRTIEFVVGCNLGYIFLMNKKNGNNREYVYTVLEFLVFVIIGVALAISYIVSDEIDLMSVDRWWMWTICFLPSSCMLVYLFAHNGGRISKLLINKILLYIGYISGYGFLIHYVVFKYLNLIVRGLGGNDMYVGWINLTVGFLFSMLLSELWIKITRP